MNHSDISEPSLATTIRTLLAAGYVIEGNERHPTHSEILCSRTSKFNARIGFMIALTVAEKFDPTSESDIRAQAAGMGRVPIFVGAYTTENQIGWSDLLEGLGGAVPSWRALGPSFGNDLLTTARNELPPGMKGEAWALFEDLVGDGMEFCLGRRVRRFGARFRGQRVSDMLAQLPDGVLLVLDAKAAKNGFDASWPALRPLVEYVKNQRERQRGHNEVFGATLVSSSFNQPEDTLEGTAQEFYAETKVALSFLTAEVLKETVTLLVSSPSIRNGLSWRRLFSRCVIKTDDVRREMAEARQQRLDGGDHV